jgi:hypothetical protein
VSPGEGVFAVEGNPAGREGEVGRVKEPFREEFGREFWRLSDIDDFERGRELLVRLEGDGISLQRPPLEGERFFPLLVGIVCQKLFLP